MLHSEFWGKWLGEAAVRRAWTWLGVFGSVVAFACADLAPPSVGHNQCNSDQRCADGARAPEASADSDRDGIIDRVDNCPLAANAGQVDTDSDGLGDLCDAEPYTKNFRLGQQMLSVSESTAVPFQASKNSEFNLLGRVSP